MDPSYIILIVALGMLGLLARQGLLRPGALDAGPSRDVGLVPADLLIALGLMIVGQALAGVIHKMSGGGLPDVEPADLPTLLLAKRVLIAQAVGQGPPVLYLIWRARAVPGGLRRIGVIPSQPLRDLAWGLLGLLAAAPMVMGTILATSIIASLFNYETPVIGHNMLKALVSSDSMLASGLIILSAVLIASILEEAIFRGLFQSVMVEALGARMRWPVVLVVSVVFALVHVGAASWQALPGLFVFGVVLGWLYERSGSLWPSIFTHIGFNALNVAIAMGTIVPDG